MFWLTIITIGISLLSGFLLRRRLWPRWFVLVALALGLTGAALLWFNLPDLRIDLERQNWPTVSGIVDSSYIAGKRAFHPEIRYHYTVDSLTFSGASDLQTPGFGGRKSRRQTSRNIIGDYPPGKMVRVYYNPAHPGESVLVHHLPWNLLMILGLGYLLIVLSLVVISSTVFSPYSRA